LKEFSRQGHEIATLILEYRKLVKFKSTYIDALTTLADHFQDKRLHPNFNQYGAKTGRFSTSNPNSQNIPTPDNDEFGLRKAFIPRPGYKLVVGDYEQLEMRIAAHLSSDKAMLEAILSGMDMHCVTITRMYPNISYEEAFAAKEAEEPTDAQKALKKLRKECKALGFGIIYGLGPKGLSEDLGISFDEADIKIKTYLRKAFRGLGDHIEATKERCRDDKYVRTLTGRRRNLPDINHPTREMRFRAERQAFNASVQGSAGDIAKGAMIRIESCERLEELGAWLINQIHDELVIEIPEQNAEEALPIIKHYMENPFGDGVSLKVPLPVDIKIVGRWADAK
jgi:DNA polymerase-1